MQNARLKKNLVALRAHAQSVSVEIFKKRTELAELELLKELEDELFKTEMQLYTLAERIQYKRRQFERAE